MPFLFPFGGRKWGIAHQSPCHFGIQLANLAGETDQSGQFIIFGSSLHFVSVRFLVNS